VDNRGKLDQEVQDAARDGRLACAVAFELARKNGVSPKEIGDAANRVGVKIVACQLGCFK
jgi:hypothetical protein